MLRHRLAVCFVLLALPASFGVSAQAAVPKTASVTLTTLTPKISVGTQPKFEYSTSGVPAGDVVVLQREQSNGSWTDVVTKPPGTNQTVLAPVVAYMGKHTYRMQSRHGTHVTAQTAHNHDVYAYDNVSIQTLCPHMKNAGASTSKVCAKNNTPVGSTNLITWMAISAAQHPNYAAGAEYDRTSCRSTALTFTNPNNATATTWLKVHQVGHADQVASAGHSKVGHLYATLYGGQLFLDGSREDNKNNGVFVGGTMSCWTSTGTY